VVEGGPAHGCKAGGGAAFDEVTAMDLVARADREATILDLA
jgi:hypothetical protein